MRASGVAAVLAAAALALAAEPKTVLLLHFDEGQGAQAVDSGPYKLHARVAKAKWVQGRFGKALEFDGDHAFVDVGQREQLDFGKTQDFTVECWIKVEPGLKPGYYYIITSRLRGDMPGYTLALGRGNNVVAGLGDKVNQVSLTTKDSVADGKWRHVALVAERKGKASLYVNGVLQAEEDISHIVTVSNPKRPLRIGDRGHDGDFIGCIDEVRISKGARTDFCLDKPYDK
ncbi:MAG TPA: LamG domain-containing protein [Candidatus Brocadiia bacterium]|nr:LamG domain-containing protein [Candidatus Brocadiia bacterium]